MEEERGQEMETKGTARDPSDYHGTTLHYSLFGADRPGYRRDGLI